MKSIKYISALLFVLPLLFQSCSKEINIDLKGTNTRLVVEGTITTDTMSHCVKLSYTADYFDNKALDPVKNALVQISDGTNTITLTENSENPGFYYTPKNYYGVVGKTYTLLISNVDIDKDGKMESYTASSYLRAVPNPDSISIAADDNFGNDCYDVRFSAQEPANTADYYMFKVRRNGAMLCDTISEAIISEDNLYNGDYLTNKTVYQLSKNKKDENIQAGDTITLEISDISKEYYQFIYDLQQEFYGSSPLSGQPANVSTNISNSSMASGFFAAYSIKRVSTIVKSKDLVIK